MPTHAENKIFNYPKEQLFKIVADVEKYPEFLPWCLASRITKREENIIYADLVIGYKMVREKFTSKVTFDEPNLIHVEYLKGPMKHLSNHWKFNDLENGKCEVDFFVDFEFKNQLLQSLMEKFFNEAVKRMIDAFEKRAIALGK